MIKKLIDSNIRTYLLVFLVSQCLLVGFLFYDKQEERNLYHRDVITRVESDLGGVLFSYGQISRVVFGEAFNRPEITDILRRAYRADAATQAQLRQDLYRKLLPTYQRLQENGVFQVQFHFPNGISFLRMQRPEEFGDALFPVRASVRIANTEKRDVQGFEEGRHYHAFRFVFPLFSQEGSHVGSVETCVPFVSVQQALSRSYPAEYFFMLKQEVVGRKLLVSRRDNYEFSDLNGDYLRGKNDVANPPDHRQHLSNAILLKIDRAIKSSRFTRKLAAEEPFVVSCSVGGESFLAVFVPVSNVEGQAVGYLYSYAPDAAAAAIHKGYLLSYALVTLLSLLLLCSHRLFAEKVRERLYFQQALLDSLPTPVFYKDTEGRYLGCNKAHAELLGVAPDHLVGRQAHDVYLKEQSECHRQREQELLATGGIDQYETAYQEAGGPGQHLVVYKTPIAAENGAVVGLIGSVFNVTELKQVEQEKEAIRRHLLLILDSAGEGIFGLDSEGRVTFCNKAAEKMLGWKAEELLGRRQHECVHGLRRDDSGHPDGECPAAKCLGNGQQMTVCDEVYWRKDGSSFLVEYATAPILDESERISGGVIIFRDITQRRQAEEALREREAQYRRIFNSTTDALLVFDARGRIVEVNRQACIMYGYAYEQFIDRSRPDIFPSGFHGEVSRFMAPSGGRHGQQLEVEGIKSDGRRFPIEVRGAGFEMKGSPHFLAVIRDISERRRVEEALRLAMEGAEAANRAKSAFLANMSHEIRTPMNAIIGMNRLALHTELTMEQHRYLKTVQDAANGLLGLLNDILDLSKIEAGQLAMEQLPFDLRATMESAVKTLAIRGHEKNLEILCSLPRHVPRGLIGDQMRLKQILLNLLGNAVKFTESGSVALYCEVASSGRGEEDRVTLHFRVVDSGIGVSADKQQFIFDDFTQADSTIARAQGGTGLGLAISKKLCEMMGGMIWLESAPGEGSVFHFTASFARGVVKPEPCFALPTGWPPGQQKSVLLAGHSAEGRAILKEMINGWGFPVMEAECGREVIAELDQACRGGAPVALLLLEQRFLSHGDDDLLGQLSKVPGYAGLPILLLHSTVAVPPCKGCREAGILFCLATPVGKAELQGAMEAALRGESCNACGLARQKLSAIAAAQTPSGLPSLKLLLVEDNDANRELARIVLENGGHVVTEAVNGLEALGELSRTRFDAILLDVQMPLLDGLSVARLLRRCEQGEAPYGEEVDQQLLQGVVRMVKGTRTPIITMTAHAMAGDREMCLAAGMDYYVTKPFQPEDVNAVLWRLIQALPQQPVVAAKPVPGATAAVSSVRAPVCPEQVKAHLINVCKMPRERVDVLFDTFRRTLVGYVVEARQALEAGDASAVRLAAHSLKGGLLNMGLADWAEVAFKIESDAKNARLGAEHVALLREVDKGLASLFVNTNRPPAKSGACLA